MKTKIDPLWISLGVGEEMDLIIQFFNGCDKTLHSPQIAVLDTQEAIDLFNRLPSICGVKNKKIITLFERKKILKPSYYNKDYYCNKKFNVNFYSGIINWKKLIDYAGILHDKEATNPYGHIEQRNIVRDLIAQISDETISDEFWISEKILRPYKAVNRLNQGLDHQYSPDHNIQFMTTIKRLEKEQFLEIKDVNFQLNNEPKYCTEIGELPHSSDDSRDFPFYPAEHCKVLIKIRTPMTTKKEQDTIKEIIIESSDKCPKNWMLVEKEGRPCLLKNKKTVFNFPSNWSQKYLYFKCLWEKCGYKVVRKTIYEYNTSKNYDKACKGGKFSTINKYIAIAVNKLRKQLKGLPIQIKTSRGFTLYFK